MNPIALHEASHATFGALLNLEMEHASIVADARTAGRVRFAFPAPQDLRGRIAWAMVLLAPRLAEGLRGVEHNAAVHADDTRQLVRALEPVHRGDPERGRQAAVLVAEAAARLLAHPAVAGAVDRIAEELATWKEAPGPWLKLMSRFAGRLPHDLAEKELTDLQRRLHMPTDRLQVHHARVLRIDETTRTIRHVISTAALDRRNRIVAVEGWDLGNFRRNPIVFADHDYSMERVIGRGIDTKVEGAALVSTTEFAAEGMGNVAFRLVQAGLVRSWSVGWQGLESHNFGSVKKCQACADAIEAGHEFGVHYTQQELLEYSLVTIPANPEAIMGLQAAGLVRRAEAEEWMEMASPRTRRVDLVAEVERVAREIRFQTALMRARS